MDNLSPVYRDTLLEESADQPEEEPGSAEWLIE